MSNNTTTENAGAKPKKQPTLIETAAKIEKLLKPLSADDRNKVLGLLK